MRQCLPLLALSLLTVTGARLSAQDRGQPQAPRPALSRAGETLAMGNEIGNKVIAMAQDFPEDKSDFKVEKDERTFAQDLLHVAAVDYDLLRSISRSDIGPGFGKNKAQPVA